MKEGSRRKEFRASLSTDFCRFSVWPHLSGFQTASAALPPRPPADLTARQPRGYRPAVAPSVADYARHPAKSAIESRGQGSASIGHRARFPPTRYGGPSTAPGVPTRTDRCLPPMGPVRMARGTPKISKIGWRNALKTPAKMGEKIVEYCGGCRIALRNRDRCSVAVQTEGEGAPALPLSRCHFTDTKARP
jgi:hypothetical protein